MLQYLNSHASARKAASSSTSPKLSSDDAGPASRDRLTGLQLITLLATAGVAGFPAIAGGLNGAAGPIPPCPPQLLLPPAAGECCEAEIDCEQLRANPGCRACDILPSGRVRVRPTRVEPPGRRESAPVGDEAALPYGDTGLHSIEGARTPSFLPLPFVVCCIASMRAERLTADGCASVVAVAVAVAGLARLCTGALGWPYLETVSRSESSAGAFIDRMSD